MEIEEKYIPFWKELNDNERSMLARSAVERVLSKGALLHGGTAGCLGLLVVRSGQLRIFVLSDEGKEITIYRLFEFDICLFSASCAMNGIQFQISIEAERETKLWVIPAAVYKKLMGSSIAAANYTNRLMASRFSEVMWLMEQIMWKSFDKRLAGFLLEERAVEGSDTITLTHDKIAAHLGTAREVVTRMLRYFQSEGAVNLSRGSVALTDLKRLRELAE
ncbi:Crp/Fnr family transcriptional regulator [Synergistes jonesii]|uniref:Crp/Fnr family transcriptional regulator n=1 Tax=Synergistes jonesii TaxID=2754 RepID=A0A073IP82_9BACT|nr:Crp/Fnr family transcriptional regulator [Synergistes jonesii]KEJ91385.1 Crp/Fnr family transcriptional regulator [Synergistes jonesii]OFB60446.1 Crp/Fnr family transcriptional regulator [Synergistes jonesii]OFB61200.1 Crp/Fnr family transcriptional regulator [Synergistes jonesii]OFB62846.1 Crp/Fnr family transcriptional regulator [Synergistes jonesii]OFB66657.1 Crp/Fnr family transcriptional regulator [Synergistes jonesii]